MSNHRYLGGMALRESVQAAVEAVADPRDQAAVELALTYAEEIDGDGDLTKLGPPLLACLEALQLSPRARAAVKKAVTGDSPTSRLDQLANRRERKSRTPDLDAAAAGSERP